MELSTAITLLAKGITSTDEPQHWTDLGAGTGLFTRALASLLPVNSEVLAIDRDRTALASIPPRMNAVRIVTSLVDFMVSIPEEKRDGFLLANSLHFVKDATSFLSRLKTKLKENGRLLIVEYDMTQPSRWVPYPVSFQRLEVLCSKAELPAPRKLADTPSRLNRTDIYSALIK